MSVAKKAVSNKAYFAAHREKILARQRAWRAAHLEAARAYDREYMRAWRVMKKHGKAG